MIEPRRGDAATPPGDTPADRAAPPLTTPASARGQGTQDLARTLERLEQANRLHAIVDRLNHAILRADTPQALYDQVCRIAVEEGGLRLAWVAELDAQTDRLRLVAWHGHGEGYLRALRERPDDPTLSDGPITQALRASRLDICDDLQHDPLLVRWREAARRHGYASRVVVPIVVGARCIAGLVLVSGQFGYFRHSGAASMRVIGDNLSFALSALQQRQESQQAQDRLRLLESCVEHLHDMVMITTAADALGQRVVFVNRAFEQRSGFTRELVLGRSPALLHGARTQGHALARLADSIERGLPVREELIFYSRDGAPYWVEQDLVPVLARAGEPAHWVAIQRDITARKATEQRLKEQLARTALLARITRAMADRLELDSLYDVLVKHLERELPLAWCAIGLLDAAPRTLRVHRLGPAARMAVGDSGLAEGDTLPLGEDTLLAQATRGEAVHVSDLADQADGFARSLAAAGMACAVLVPMIADGQLQGIILAARRAPDRFSAADRDFLRQLGEHAALAARQAGLHVALQRAYDDLRRTQEAVARQERLRALGQMASGVAHDINNALSPLALYTDTLLEQEPGLSEGGRRQLAAMQHAIEDIARTVARMRDLYRPAETPTAPIARETDVNVLVQDALDLTRPRWRDMAQVAGAAIEVRTELQPGLPPLPIAPDELQGALTHLILNAVDAMPRGGELRVRTDLSTDPEGTAQLRITVGDTGIGMDEPTRQRCMEPFFTTKGTRGTGLGLSLVNGTMERHGGRVVLRSVLGEGTAVGLVFPLPQQAAHPAPAAWPIDRNGAALRLLVVDDDELVRQALAARLTADGHCPELAEGGQAGIDAFHAALGRGQPHDAVITDLGMPRVDGRAVAAAVKQARPETLVLMLTGWGHDLEAGPGPVAHVDAVLPKPPRLVDLRAALARCRPGTDASG